jgi:hypothetical protein
MPMDYTSDTNTPRGMSPSLAEQTPGMDATREVRDVAMRQWAWARENKGIALGLIGGLAAIGIGTWLIVRSRRPTRLEMLRDRGSDIADWIRSKIA